MAYAEFLRRDDFGRTKLHLKGSHAALTVSKPAERELLGVGAADNQDWDSIADAHATAPSAGDAANAAPQALSGVWSGLATAAWWS